MIETELSENLNFEVIKSCGLTPEEIIEGVVNYWKISREDLISHKRDQQFVLRRRILAYSLRTLTDLSFPAIGELMNQDHSTVITSFRHIENRIKGNVSFWHSLLEFLKTLNPSLVEPEKYNLSLHERLELIYRQRMTELHHLEARHQALGLKIHELRETLREIKGEIEVQQ